MGLQITTVSSNVRTDPFYDSEYGLNQGMNMKNTAIILISMSLISCAVKKETTSPAEKDCWVYIRNAIKLREQKKYQMALDETEKNGACDKPEAGMPYYYHLGWTYYEMGDY